MFQNSLFAKKIAFNTLLNTSLEHDLKQQLQSKSKTCQKYAILTNPQINRQLTMIAIVFNMRPNHEKLKDCFLFLKIIIPEYYPSHQPRATIINPNNFDDNINIFDQYILEPCQWQSMQSKMMDVVLFKAEEFFQKLENNPQGILKQEIVEKYNLQSNNQQEFFRHMFHIEKQKQNPYVQSFIETNPQHPFSQHFKQRHRLLFENLLILQAFSSERMLNTYQSKYLKEIQDKLLYDNK